jgi:hypothetical protein
MAAKLIQVTSMATKHVNKGFLFRLENFFPRFSLGVEGLFWTRCVVSFGVFDYFLLFVVVECRNKLGSSLLTLVLTPLKANARFVCGFGCTPVIPHSERE